MEPNCKKHRAGGVGINLLNIPTITTAGGAESAQHHSVSLSSQCLTKQDGRSGETVHSGGKASDRYLGSTSLAPAEENRGRNRKKKEEVRAQTERRRERTGGQRQAGQVSRMDLRQVRRAARQEEGLQRAQNQGLRQRTQIPWQADKLRPLRRRRAAMWRGSSFLSWCSASDQSRRSASRGCSRDRDVQ